jgi:hypothetical protein
MYAGYMKKMLYKSRPAPILDTDQDSTFRKTTQPIGKAASSILLHPFPIYCSVQKKQKKR